MKENKENMQIYVPNMVLEEEIINFLLLLEIRMNIKVLMIQRTYKKYKKIKKMMQAKKEKFMKKRMTLNLSQKNNYILNCHKIKILINMCKIKNNYNNYNKKK